MGLVANKQEQEQEQEQEQGWAIYHHFPKFHVGPVGGSRFLFAEIAFRGLTAPISPHRAGVAVSGAGCYWIESITSNPAGAARASRKLFSFICLVNRSAGLNSANTNGRIDGVVDHVRDLHGHLDRAQNETNAALMNIQNDLTDVRGDIKEIQADVADMRRNLDLTTTVAEMRKQIDALAAEVADLKRRAS